MSDGNGVVRESRRPFAPVNQVSRFYLLRRATRRAVCGPTSERTTARTPGPVMPSSVRPSLGSLAPGTLPSSPPAPAHSARGRRRFRV